MIKFLRGTGIGPMLLLIVVTAALWAETFINPPQILISSGAGAMPLWNIILKFLNGSPLAAAITSFTMMLLLVIIMIRFNTSLFFIARRTYLPALFYILLYSIFPGDMVLNPALPAAIFLAAGLWRMMAAYRMNGIAYNLFDAALLVSVAGLFYAGAVWFVLLVFIGTIMLRSSDLREITLTLFGAILPWLVLYAVWYLTGGEMSDLTEIIRHNLFDESNALYWSRILVILVIVIALWFLPALAALVSELPTKKIRSRKIFALLIWMLVISAAVFALLPSVSVEITAIAAIPLSFIMANYCAFTRRILTTELFLWVTMLLIVISHLWPY
jgi:hypothetical protein